MISCQSALDLIRQNAGAAIATENVALQHACGRITGLDCQAKLANPPFDNALVDGFVLRAEDTKCATPDSPVVLRILGRIGAGERFRGGTGALSGSALEIMTGAPIPEGFDAVVRVEDTRSEQGRVFLTYDVPCGHNIKPEGEDVKPGDILIKAGTVLQPQHLMALASSGLTQVQARRRARVAVVCSGNEIVDAGSAPGYGQIYNSIQPYLRSALELAGCEVLSCESVRDDAALFCARMGEILRLEPDIVITSGAVSMGVYDFIPAALNDLGAKIIFHRVAVRPGKPNLFAVIPQAASAGHTAVFGLPGNPVSVAAGLRFFVTPYLDSLNGMAREQACRLTLEQDVTKPRDLTVFSLGRRKGGTFAAEARQMSYFLNPILRADCWAVLPEGEDMIRRGRELECFNLYRGSTL